MGYSIVSKKRQAAVNQHQPWRQSTGARTEEGRRLSAQNSTVHGLRSQEFLAIKKALAQAEALLAEGFLEQITTHTNNAHSAPDAEVAVK
ncbi:hypothetical protein [Pseudoalteromonas umbrosa]|uniref:hypothetical protein n=1 Tax=Pseudoalteromonas umbrosa TaxID=3048489 RepID=UPI0024C328F7|nr:hypothetical protein [Pseudoalteromonas sp. B95]MDK1290148.1 hypothetical protein [Pseudoalteromonas sp. B95]